MTGVVLSQGRSGQAKTDGCCAANQDCSHCESFRHGREVSIASSNWLGAVGENETQLHNAGAATSNHSCFSASADRKSVVSGKGVLVRVDLGGRLIFKKKPIEN